ncbi:MAG: CpXC domain-containing protein [Anaerolineae bacterium]|nr:CpXC domain-containing protein [Anaerolineae bacterium]
MSQILRPGAGGVRGGPEAAVPGVQIRCPRCQTPYAAQIINVVDARLAPELKAALLAGYLNRAVCPSCGAVTSLSVPLVYHDPDKELLLVLVPTELNMTAQQQERLVGGLVQAIMSHVPPEERKGYFLRPQTVLTMQRLVESVLEADGVTREMIEAQNRRFRLLEEMLRAVGDEARLSALIEEHRGELDYAFLATLSSAAQEAALASDSSGAEQLQALRDRLLQDPQVAARVPRPLPPDATLEEALEQLLSVADDEPALAAMTAINRPAFDYLFFQGLTAEMDRARGAGDAARAERLAALRSRLLQEIEQQDRALQAAQQQDLRLLEEILRSPDREATIRDHLAEMDTLFLNTLSAAIEGARRQGDIERSARLDEVRNAILSMMAEAMPPELKLVNQLLGLEDVEERRAVLAESAGLLSEDLLALIDALHEELEGQGRERAARQLETVREEIHQALTVQGSAKPSP